MPLAGMLYSFNAGEWSPEFGGRVDLGKYPSSMRRCNNFVPRVMGLLKKRPGTRYVSPAKTHVLADRVRLVPFVFSNVQAYTLEFGSGYCRIYRNGARVESGGLPVEVALPYSTADLRTLQWVQSADVLYLAHPSHPPRKLTRTSDTAWTTEEIDFAWPAFRPENVSSTTVYASAATGAGITLTASAAIFTSDMIGSHVRLRELTAAKHSPWQADIDCIDDDTGVAAVVNDRCQFGGNVYYLSNKFGAVKTGNRPPVHLAGTEKDGRWNWTYVNSGAGYAEITAIGGGGTTATATVIVELPASVVGVANATDRWSLGAWNAEHGYPRSVAFYEDRLLWAGTDADPQTVWFSQISDYENHQLQGDDLSAMLFALSEDEANVVHWIAGGKVLGIGTSGAEFIAVGADGEKPISPSNPMKATSHNKQGSVDHHKPLRIDNVFVFLQRAGRNLHELVYDFGSDSYVAPDLMLLADHIALAGVAEFAWQQKPDRTIWACLEDGGLRAAVYDRQQEVVGWHRHTLAGTNAFVESLCVIPHPDGDQDQVWFAVRRTINGTTFRSIETLEKPWDRGDTLALSCHVDLALSRTGAGAITHVTGFDHLVGETVWAWADAQIQGPFVVAADGSFDLTSAATNITAGLRYAADMISCRPELGLRDGTTQGRLQTAPRTILRLDQAGPGLFVAGARNDATTATWDPLTLRTTYDELGQPMDLFDGDTEPVALSGGWSRDGGVRVKHESPAPCAILAILPEHEIGGR